MHSARRLRSTEVEAEEDEVEEEEVEGTLGSFRTLSQLSRSEGERREMDQYV